MKAKPRTFVHFSCLILSAFLFWSCATSPVLIKNSTEDYKALKDHKVGVAFFIPDQRVLFTEQIYLVIGYADQHRFHAYEGIWDPIPVLQEKVLNELKANYQITPIDLKKVMRPEAVSIIDESCRKNFNQDLSRVRKAGHHNEFLRVKLTENVLSELKKTQIDYFLEVYLASISFYDFAHYDWITGGVETYSRLNRVSDGSIVWLNKSRGGTLLKNLKSLTELENNDMAILKQGYQEAVSKCEVLTGFAPQ